MHVFTENNATLTSSAAATGRPFSAVCSCTGIYSAKTSPGRWDTEQSHVSEICVQKWK